VSRLSNRISAADVFVATRKAHYRNTSAQMNKAEMLALANAFAAQHGL
jgi:hypothetical protein